MSGQMGQRTVSGREPIRMGDDLVSGMVCPSPAPIAAGAPLLPGTAGIGKGALLVWPVNSAYRLRARPFSPREKDRMRGHLVNVNISPHSDPLPAVEGATSYVGFGDMVSNRSDAV
jgi:hypothetical protein